jgi:hypothetical protein
LYRARRFGGGAGAATPFVGSERLWLGYISGLVAAEGSFHFSPRRPRFALHLRQDDRALLTLLAERTGIGRIYDYVPPAPLNPSSTWSINAAHELAQLLTVLREADLPGRKRREMESWSIAVDEMARARGEMLLARIDLLRLSASQLRRDRLYRPSTGELLNLPRRDVRAECLAALRTWSDKADGTLSCVAYSRWRRGRTAPTRNTVVRAFGSWYAALEAAGVAARAARRTVKRSGGEGQRRVMREQQRARVLAAVRRFEGEHGRLPRAMEFFRWRFEGAPDSPTQATVYKLFPGGWAAVLDACRAGYGLG